jgi:hypothetical protein
MIESSAAVARRRRSERSPRPAGKATAITDGVFGYAICKAKSNDEVD